MTMRVIRHTGEGLIVNKPKIFIIARISLNLVKSTTWHIILFKGEDCTKNKKIAFRIHSKYNSIIITADNAIIFYLLKTLTS